MNLITRCCEHPSEMHTQELGCVLCDCTTGRATSQEPFEAGSVVWHQHREQVAVYLGDSDLDSETGIVDFGQGGEQRVSLNQLQPVMNPREAASWADTFAAMRVIGFREITWGPDRPTVPYRAAMAIYAAYSNFVIEWHHTEQGEDGYNWAIACTEGAGHV